ncbi:MAG TPA: hypothetical protein VGO43_14215 [Pyrinomonadaceae bacterium]|jgi:hypothetical protein|nr:hypothetical protein [Pyrinomonadaceae bacterium]
MSDKIVVEKEVLVPTEGGNGTASNAIWAVALVIIVALVVFAVWKSGVLRRVGTPQKVDVEVSVPAR